MNTLKNKWRKRDLISSLSAGKKIILILMFSLCTGLGMSVLMSFIRLQSTSAAYNHILNNMSITLWTAAFIFLITASLSFIARSVFFGCFITSLAAIALFFSNHFKLLITTVPLQLADLSLIFRAADITRLNAASIAFSWRDIFCIIATLLWLGIVFVFSKPLRMPWKPVIYSAASSLSAFCLLFTVFANSLVYSPLDFALSRRIPVGHVEYNCGVVLSLWRTAIAPNGLFMDSSYTEDFALELLSEVKEHISETVRQERREKQPNIIVLLSESFFDITTLENLTFEKDPLVEFRSICEESVYGDFYTPTLGYGTSNIELNVLTGINPELMIPGENPCTWDSSRFEYIPAIPKILAENGYFTASLHTFNDSIYNRSNYFNKIGFQKTFFSGDFAEIDDEAASAENYYTYLSEKISGGYYSDDYLSDVIIKLYEKKSPKSPVFLYGFTMENHSPYLDTRNGGGFDFSTTAELTDEAQLTISNLTQGLHNASLSLKKLVDYFSQNDDPTIIVFFGDHRPGTGLSDNSTVYSQLGIVPDHMSEWTIEQTKEFHRTSYLIWANDDTLLPEKRGSKIDSSANYLGVSMLEASGVKMPLFWQFLKSMRNDSLFYSWKYYMSSDGDLLDASELPNESTALRKQQLMGKLLYDTFYGKQIITKELGGYMP